MNPAQQAMAALHAATRQVFGVVITYRRGDHAVTLTAVRGKTDAVMVNGGGAAIDAKIDDFIILASELVLDGAAILPAEADTIAVADVPGAVFEVAGSPAWRYSDPQETQYRVHTNRIKA
jgi:hypothetical protein